MKTKNIIKARDYLKKLSKKQHVVPLKESTTVLLYRKIIQLKIKRLVDIVLSLILIGVLLPILIFVSIAILISSTGPIIYKSKRVGLFGDHFFCFKFRSMVTELNYNKDDLKSSVKAKNNGVLFKVSNDSRVTSIGKIIRKTSIDELPQLFNVLIGDMSIVGPRPLVPHMLVNYQEFNSIRSLLKPGITGRWQIENRENNTSATDMLEYDISYIQKYSLLEDMKILMKTPKVVLSTKGAY